MNANEILKIVRGLRVAMSLADAVPTEAHKHEGDLKWFGEVVNVHGGYDAIRDALEAARAAAVATDPVGILLKLCDQLETMKHLMVLHPSGGQNYPYLDRDNVMAYVEQARAALSKSDTNLSEDERAEWSFKQWWAHVGAWETPEGFISFGSPMAVRAMLIQFGRMVEARAALRQPGALPDVCAEMRALCSSCGGTGDVTSIDGEWRGSCDCEASKGVPVAEAAAQADDVSVIGGFGTTWPAAPTAQPTPEENAPTLADRGVDEIPAQAVTSAEASVAQPTPDEIRQSLAHPDHWHGAVIGKAAQPTPREQSEARQRAKLQARFATRASSPASADFDLPAQGDAAQPTPPDDERAAFTPDNLLNLKLAADELRTLGYSAVVDDLMRIHAKAAALRQPGALPDGAEDAAQRFAAAIVEAQWSDDDCNCPWCGTFRMLANGDPAEHEDGCIVHAARAAAATKEK